MKIFLDDARPAPEGYTLCKSVNEAKKLIEQAEKEKIEIDLLDLDYDMGDYNNDGGDGAELLYWLIERKTFYKVNLHTSDLVGRDNMAGIIYSFWKE